MKILMITPSYSDHKSEELFLNALQKVDAYKDIKTMGSHYLLELKNTFDMQTVSQLHQLFTAWDIDRSPLSTLAELAISDTE